MNSWRHKVREFNPGELPDPREMKLDVKPLDLAVMLFHIYEAARDPELGFTDAERRLRSLANDMTRRPARLKQSIVESALYFCNMRAEQGKFWHPLDKNIDEFLSDVVKTTNKPYRFDKDYHLFFSE
jgi:hypothetical protein